MGVRRWDVLEGGRLAGEKNCVLKFNVRKIMLNFEHF